MNSIDAPVVAHTLVGIANLALHQGQPADAAALLAASTAIRGAADLSRPDAARIAAATRQALGDREFAEAGRRGVTATMVTAREVAAPVLG